jgi:hypothetical protein
MRRANRFDEHCTACTLPKQAWEAKYAAFTVAELGELLQQNTPLWDFYIPPNYVVAGLHSTPYS